MTFNQTWLNSKTGKPEHYDRSEVFSQTMDPEGPAHYEMGLRGQSPHLVPERMDCGFGSHGWQQVKLISRKLVRSGGKLKKAELKANLEESLLETVKNLRLRPGFPSRRTMTQNAQPQLLRPGEDSHLFKSFNQNVENVKG